MEDDASLEEMNKTRIALGLKPLTADDEDEPAEEDKEGEAESNYAQWREEQAKEKERKKIADRIAKVKNKRELNASLKGATLGDADAETDDTLKWIKKSKKREKELAKKRLQEMDEMDKQFQGADYGEKDLEGLKVSHDLDELGEGDERILTLKDSRILDNEEDELQNVEMAEHERAQKNIELKTKKHDYTGYDDDEFKEGQVGMRKSILSKYDEDLEGSGETGFRLGASRSKAAKVNKEAEQSSAGTSVKKQLLSLDYEKNFETSDYLREGDVGFKKPKTKKKRPTRRVAEDSGIEPVSNGDAAMEVDQKPSAPRQRNLDDNFVDDDELQASLARARKAKTMKRKIVTPEELARRNGEEGMASRGPADGNAMKIEEDEEEDDGTGLTFDDTSEFVRAVQYNPVVAKKEPKAEARDIRLKSPTPVERGDVRMEDADEAVEELEAGELPVKDEEDDEEMLHALEQAINVAEAEEGKVNREDADAEVGTAAEQNFASGMAATLKILKQQGVIAESSADQKERERVQRQRDLWLAEYRTRGALRELEKLKSRGEKKDQAQREYENRLREQQEARENLDIFKDYKPDVNIVYHDEFGRELTPKEAWKALSHRFHGKGSGKMKTEKRLKKIAEEKKKEAMASGETPLSMNRAFQIRQEKTGQAHFVLSVGNRGAVPQAAEFLEPPTLSKGKTEKTKKKKEATKEKIIGVDFTGVTPSIPLSSSVSPGPGSQRDSPAPNMMKSSFSQVVEPAVSSGSGSGTPNGGDRVKLAFGFGTKRKAAGEGEGTPPPKRR